MLLISIERDRWYEVFQWSKIKMIAKMFSNPYQKQLNEFIFYSSKHKIKRKWYEFLEDQKKVG